MNIHDFFKKFEGTSLSYDDLILLPNFIDFGVEEVHLTTRLTRDLHLKAPFISSPMDTVSESDLVISLALLGGIGVIHYNMTPEEQVEQLKKVKRFKNGVITDPITLPKTATIREVQGIREKHGYSTIPITDGGVLLGMITKYDYSTLVEGCLDQKVTERMIPIDSLVTTTSKELAELGLTHANEKLLTSHSGAMPILDESGKLVGLITRSDLEKHQNYPNASLDSSQSLLVGAAVETWAEKAYPRIEAVSPFVDVVVFDTSQGYTSYEIELIRWVKKNYPDIQVIAGNVVTEAGCKALIDAGADAIRVGMGCGSICTTQEVAGVGRGQASAVYECSKADIPVIADGGIRHSSDMIKALSLGANAVMLGSLLAGTAEAPGTTKVKDGVFLKEYRGMGSLEAMQSGSATRYGIQKSQVRVPEGVQGLVPYAGNLSQVFHVMMQGMRQGFHKLGYRTIADLHIALKNNQLQLERRSEASKQEGRVHSLAHAERTQSPAEVLCQK